MLSLLLSAAGTGKTYWLQSQKVDLLIQCTNLSHRSILCEIADHLQINYQTRATVDELTGLIMSAPPVTLALDDIDRTGSKLQYSLITLSTRHEITATATLAKRVTIITERTAAALVPVPRVSLAEVARSNYPTLTPAQVRRVSMVATTPAHAVTLARALHDGREVPTPPTQSNTWLLLLVGIAVIAYIRYVNPEMSPVTIAIITAGGYVLRRLLWRSL